MSYDAPRWDETKRAYVLDGQVMRGVHPVISEAFYPSYTYDRAKYGPVVRRKTHVARERKSGLEIGQLVDRQFIEICYFVREHGLGMEHIDSPTGTPLPLNVRSVPALAQRVAALQRDLHPYTRNIMRALSREKLVPRYAQWVVANKAMRLATAVDLVCVRAGREGQLVLVEIKCGFDLYLDRHTKDRLRAPFQSFNDSPRNQHQLQLGITVALWAASRRTNAMQQEAYVVRAHETGVTVTPLEAWVRARLTAMQFAILGDMNAARISANAAPDISHRPGPMFYRASRGEVPLAPKKRGRSKSAAADAVAPVSRTKKSKP